MKLIPEINPVQSIELLKELHILTKDGKINQDTRRKLKQVYHLCNFIEPLLKKLEDNSKNLYLVDHGAGKSYLGFILYDLFLKQLSNFNVIGIESRHELVNKSIDLASKLKFKNMAFHHLTVAESISSELIPNEIDIVTALHACDTATDDAIDFGLSKKSRFLVLVPCCQAQVASYFRKYKNQNLGASILTQLWRHPIHTREFSSHLTNVLRCMRLEAHGYQVTVTELIGWEHSMKNELIIAEYKNLPTQKPRENLQELLKVINLPLEADRFSF